MVIIDSPPAALRRGHGPMLVEAGNLALVDWAEGTWDYRGRCAHLSPIESRFMLLLAQRAGANVSRADIEQIVFGARFVVRNTKKINIHVRNIRSKLDLTVDELILTVRGFGYRLDVD